MHEIVIARYKENINWSENLNDFKISVYNKDSGFNLIPNVGFEANTYLYHIVTRYQSLSEITVFTQGSLKEHLALDVFKKHLIKLNSTQFMPFTGKTFCLNNGCPHHCGLKISNFWKFLFDTKCPDVLEFSPAAIFSVPAKIIRMRKLDFYKKALDITKTKHDACVMERLWNKIFSPPVETIKFF